MSNIRDMEQLIREHPFSKGMPEEHIAMLTGCAQNVSYRKGEFIFRQGEDADAFYLVRGGRVSLELNAPPKGTIEFDSRKAGDVLGWSWIVEPYRWYSDARAVEDVRALEFNAVCLRTKWDRDTRLAYEMYRRFVPLIHRSLQATQLQLLDMYGAN